MSMLLRKMTQKSFQEYLDKAIPAYASNNIESGRWLEEGALERSRADHESLLPDGLNTKNNYLFDIVSRSDNCIVGFLWLAVEDKFGSTSAFIYDIAIYESYRRLGYARQALKELELFVKDLGICKIGLHVFHQNKSAQSLYESMGFSVVSSNMAKSIA